MQQPSQSSRLKVMLQNILSTNQKTKEIIGQKEMMNDLLSGLSSPLNLNQFTTYLQAQAGLTPKQILKILNELISSPQPKQVLGQRLFKQFFLFRLYEAKDFLGSKQKKNRQKLKKAFHQFQFHKDKSIEDLLRAINIQSSQEIEQLKDFIQEQLNKEGQINKLMKQEIKKTKETKEIKQIKETKKQIAYNPDKSAQETLYDLIADQKIMPEQSLEKMVQKWLIFAHTFVYPEGNQIIKKSMIKLPASISQIDIFKNTCIEKQQYFGLTSQQFQKRFKQLTEKKLYQLIYFFKSKICAVNVPELLRLINKTKDSEKLIQNKEVILFIGNTGSGKSTTLLKFLNYNLIKGIFNGLQTLVYTGKLKEQHKSFYTSPEAKSCTRYINAVPIPDEMYPRGTMSQDKTLVLCDSPGFGDSAGVQVDIANGVGMINALRKAASGRIVVVIPHESLIADRMSGAVKISEIISNLFSKLSTVIESIKILFNKTPSEKIQQIPNLIENKLEYLTVELKSNQGLTCFLHQIKDQSKQKENFINPIEGDFKKLFNKIREMPPITNMQLFRYEFTDATKQIIQNFALSSKNQIKEYCNNKKFQYSFYHFKNLRQLSNILSDNNKLRQCNKQMTKFVQQTSKSLFDSYQQQVNSIINQSKKNQPKNLKIQLIGKNIQYFYQKFKQFDDLRPYLKSKLDISEIINQKAIQLQGFFNNIHDVNLCTIWTIKSFCEEFKNRQLQKNISNKLDKQFRSTLTSLKEKFKEKRYSQMGQNLPTLKHLQTIIPQLNKSKHNIQFQINNFLEQFTNHIKKGQQQLSRIQKEQSIRQIDIVRANENLKQTQEILKLDFLTNNSQYQKRIDKILSNIQSQCRKRIRLIENLNTLQVFTQNSSKNKNQLKKRLTHIELLMKIGDIKQRLFEEYVQAKKSIEIKLQENQEIITQFIQALKGNNIEQLDRNLGNIKKARNSVIQCCQILGIEGKNLQSAKSIQQEFIKYLNKQTQGLKSIDSKLGESYQQKFKIIQLFYQKIENYEKMGEIGEKIKAGVQLFRNQFYKKLKKPFEQFQSKYIQSLKLNEGYQYLPNILQKFQKYTNYVVKIQQLLDKKSYQNISQEEPKILEILKRIYDQMRKDISKFETFKLGQTNPTYLKQLLKTLLSHSQDHNFIAYLGSKLNFQVKDYINTIQRILFDIKEILQNNLENYQVDYCKFYCQIQDIYKIKRHENQKFGFKDIHKKLQHLSTLKIKQEDQRTAQMVSINQPSRICFNDLKILYEQFKLLPKEDSERKRKIITNGLGKTQKKILDSLRQYNIQLEDTQFISNRAKLSDFLQCFSEAITLQRQLKQLYTLQSDKKLITINLSTFIQIKSKINNLYQAEFKSLAQILENYHISNSNEKLRVFGQLQNMIFQLFSLDKVNFELQQTQDREDKQLILFITQKNNELKTKIKSMSNQKNEQIKQSKTKKLRPLFQILMKKIQDLIKNKYECSVNFTIDINLKKYYQSILKNAQKKENIESNIQSYLQNLFDNYQINRNKSSDQANRLIQEIQNQIKLLPSKLQKQYADQFKKLKQKIIQKQNLVIEQIYLRIIQQPKNIGVLFEKANKAQQSNQKDLFQKLLTLFKRIYHQLQAKVSIGKIQQKIQFVRANLLQIYPLLIKYQKMADFFKHLSNRINHWLQKLVNLCKNKIDMLKKFLQNQTKLKEKEIQDNRQLIRQIFLIHNFICTMKQVDIKNQKCQYIKAHETYETNFGQKINNVIDIYSKFVDNKPELKIKSEQILNLQKMAIFSTYIEELKIKNQVMKEFIQHLLKGNALREKLQKLSSYFSVLELYQEEVKQMIKFMDNYEFYGDNKRNMANNQLQADLSTLNKYYSILEGGQIFFNSKILQKPYIISEISALINNKFQKHFTLACTQIKQTFKNISSQPLERPNLLINQLRILKKNKDKQVKCILFEIDTKLESIQALIKQSFQEIKKKCEISLTQFQYKYEALIKKIQLQNSNMKTLIKVQQEKTKKTKKERITQQQNKLKPLIDINDQNSSKYKKQLQVQKNGISKQMNDQFILKIKLIQEHCQNLINKYKKEQLQSAKQTTSNLIIFQKALIDISSFSDKYQKLFDLIFQLIQKKNYRLIQVIEQSFLDNNQDQRSFGKTILMNKKVFSSYAIKKINNIMKAQDINYILKYLQKINLRGRDKLKKDELDRILTHFQKFDKKYVDLKKQYSDNPKQSTISTLVLNLKNKGESIKDKFYQAKKPIKQSQPKLQLLAGIFALWAIINSKTRQNNKIEFTIEPHPTQIATLILLLGILDPSQIISNRFAQVGTGQGKSIILAGLSCFLALTGFSVRCACYSPYLSQRDSQGFKELFQQLGVQNNIKYGTFNQLCEAILNNNGKNLALQVGNMILAPPQSFLHKFVNVFGGNLVSFDRNSNQIKNNPTILVIDQVDVFFQDSFFGNTYCPAMSLEGQNVRSMYQYIWKQVQKQGEKTNPQDIIKSQCYKKLVKEFKPIQELLKNQINGMIVGALNYKHDYLIIEKKIVYKDGDFISNKISYGYKTSFANLHQYKKQNITKTNLDQSLKINLTIAEFSYALLPKYFTNILGVTGTLELLPYYKKLQLKQKYNIIDQYAIPSPFGINKKRIEKYCITSQENCYKQIVTKIQEVKENRPIVIFFKGINQLNQFATCNQFSKHVKRSNNITENHQAAVRNSRILQSVNAGNITLMSSVFGRGTDLMVLNDKINQNGGLHIIQAFLSLEQSQEIQVKGRTARQNSPGSYDCIIDQNWLQQLNIKSKQILIGTESSLIHTKIYEARERRSDLLAQNTKKMLEQANKKHYEVTKIFESPNLSQKDLILYIYNLNKYPEIKRTVIKTVLALDATGSMANALQKTCQIIGSTFEQVFDVLKEKKVKATIEIKIKLFRNYNSPHNQIIQGTAFQNIANNLKVFLSKVSPKGGWGNEAVQVLFQSLNRQDKLDQVILIGDAAPNTVKQVNEKRSHQKGSQQGQYYWRKNGFPVTNIEQQLSTFIKTHQHCPVHSFYLNNGQGFQSISQKTNGQAKKFQINLPKITDILQAFVVENILKIVQKKEGSTNLNLVEIYRNRKMYVDRPK